MVLNDELSLLEEFTHSAAVAKRLRLWEFEEIRQQTDQRQGDEKREREKEWAALEDDAPATTVQLTEFRDRMDRYDTAAVTALMENETALSTATARLDQIRSQAFVLPDGRRVYKSADGQHVYDEQGKAVSSDSIDPASISGSHSSWETYTAAVDSHTNLEQERAALIQFQAQVDAAREATSKDHVSAADLAALGADLKASAPDAVKRQMAERAPDTIAPDKGGAGPAASPQNTFKAAQPAI